jgi:hypothetical protein
VSDTATSSFSNNIGLTAKMIRLLVEAGMSTQGFQAIIDDRSIRGDVIRVVQEPEMDFQMWQPPIKAAQALIDAIWPWPDDMWDYRKLEYGDWGNLHRVILRSLRPFEQYVVGSLFGFSGVTASSGHIAATLNIANPLWVEVIRARALAKLRDRLILDVWQKGFRDNEGPIEALDLTDYTMVCLHQNGIWSIESLLGYSADGLRTRVFNPDSKDTDGRVQQIIDALVVRGVSLRPEPDDYPCPNCATGMMVRNSSRKRFECSNEDCQYGTPIPQ